MLLVAGDVYRPAAIDQLITLGKKIEASGRDESSAITGHARGTALETMIARGDFDACSSGRWGWLCCLIVAFYFVASGACRVDSSARTCLFLVCFSCIA